MTSGLSRLESEARISIVTISYNQKEFLGSALDSVLDQHDSNTEYIVVDAGSTDGSRDLLNTYKPRLSRLVFEPDQGPPDGLNRGFSHATGEIFGFLNSDDLLGTGSLASIRDYFSANPTVDLLVGNGWIVDECGSHLRHVRGSHFGVSTYLLGGASWLQQATFFRKQIFREVGGFNPSNKTCWDGELFLRMLRGGAKVGYLGRDLGYFRLHSKSITVNGNLTRHQYMLDCDRLFRETFGRNRTFSDSLLSMFYRARSLSSNPQYFASAILQRFGRSA